MWWRGNGKDPVWYAVAALSLVLAGLVVWHRPGRPPRRPASRVLSSSLAPTPQELQADEEEEADSSPRRAAPGIAVPRLIEGRGSLAECEFDPATLRAIDRMGTWQGRRGIP